MPSESDSVLLLLGDDGTNKEATSTGKLNQENEHIYNLWCSGRVCCEGMLIQLRVSRERLLRHHPPLRFKSEVTDLKSMLPPSLSDVNKV